MPTNQYTIKLSEIEEGSIKQVGGKAVNLGFLTRKGFNVPAGFVVTTDAYNLFIKENKLQSYILDELAKDPTQASQNIREAITLGEIPEDIREEIINQYHGLARKEIAIRSSATSEDLKDASFAGQMDTFLNVNTSEAVLRYIKHCYASLWTSRAISYRAKNSIDHKGVSIAVVVQEIIEPKAAGVMFTHDPVSSENSIVLESNYGYGESVVSGKATPDRFKINRGAMEITVREIGTKELEAVKSLEGGIVFVETSLERREQPSLTDDEILGLVRLGADVETAYGAPQDIEWAVADDLYLLQSRPITTAKNKHDATAWTRGYSDDYWNDNVSPLFFELMGDHITEIVNVELNELMGYTKPGEMNTLLKLHKAHAYFNLDVLKHKVIYEIPTFIRNNDVLNYFPEGSGPYGKETVKNLPFHLAKRINAEYRIRTRDPNGATDRTADAYDKWTNEVLDPFWRGFKERLNKLDGEPLVSYLGLMDELNDVIIEHFRLVRYGIPVHNIGMNLMTQYLLKRFLGEEKASLTYPILVSGLKHSTSKTNETLFKLAAHIRANPPLRELVLETESELIPDRLVVYPDSSEFLLMFNCFMDDYGCRGFTREPFYPRWSEAPRYVFDILKSLVVDEGSDLTVIEERNSAERQRVEAEIRETIGSQPLGWAKNKLLDAIVGVARRYIVFREEQRYNLDKWISMNRLLYMGIGERLTEQGILNEPNDIFFLHRDEIKQAINGNPKVNQKTIQHRRSEFHRYENITPPKFLEGDREYNDPIPPTAQTYYGLPASQGVLTGTVRVLNSITEITEVRAGEILVVPRTDPGWTPVFSKIGGLITETGGVLSHGAVVSREYGVPAVTNISNACRIFQTGQVITINGATGSVHLDE